MIASAEEFNRLRNSENPEEYNRASLEESTIKIWKDVIQNYPDMKEWVIHNKTIQIEILEELALDKDPKIRSAVAMKRKINDIIFEQLKSDSDESVRYALICNTKLSNDKKETIHVSDSEWLSEKLKEQLK